MNATKTTQFQLRCTPEQLERWKLAAGQEPLSHWLRRAAEFWVEHPQHLVHDGEKWSYASGPQPGGETLENNNKKG